MKRIAKGILERQLARRGYQIARATGPDHRAPPPDFDAQSRHLFEQVRDFTLTSPERIFAFREAIRYVVAANIGGAIVECGVWRGGSMMAAALTLVEVGSDDRDLYLYDTFEGPPELVAQEDIERDGDHFARVAAARGEPTGSLPSVLQLLPLDGVKQAMRGTGYPDGRVHYIAGMVEDTIPDKAPDAIAVLRLDTDRYSSTRHELVHLYPRIVDGGVLIIDDYASWKGSRDATDEYFADQGIVPLLHRIDSASRTVLVRRP